MSIYILFFLVLVYLLISALWNRQGGGVPFVPADKEAINRIMDLGEVGEGDVFYELGSGDGRLVIAAAMRGAESYGIEVSWIRVIYSQIWCKILGLKNVQIIKADFNEVDLSRATVVCAYLLQEVNDNIQNKLSKELKKGTKIISCAFEFKGWEPIKTEKRGVYYGPLRLYKIS